MPAKFTLAIKLSADAAYYNINSLIVWTISVTDTPGNHIQVLNWAVINVAWYEDRLDTCNQPSILRTNENAQ